jgi:hypothetical protein
MNGHLLATFTHQSDALAAVDRAQRELPDADIHIGDTDDALDALVLGQRREMAESIPAPAGGLFSGPFARGALVWGVVGVIIGALMTAPVSLFVDAGDLSRARLALLMAIVGALGLGSAAFVLGAARQAIKEGATMPIDPTAVVRLDGPGRAEDAIRVLREAGARNTRLVEGPIDRVPTSDVEAPHAFPGDPADWFGSRSDSDAGFRSDAE